MKAIARKALLAAGALVALWLAYRVCYLRAVCNVRSAQAQRSVNRIVNYAEQTAARIVARRAIEEMDHCVAAWPTNIQLLTVRAAALRILDRPAEASLDYRRALGIDRRAELYFNLGMSELEAGREQQAFDALVTAGFMFNPYVEEAPEPMRSRVRAAVMPVFDRMVHGRTSPEEIEQVRQRVVRDPL